MTKAAEHFAAGQKAYASGALDEALAHLEQAYELAPSPELSYNLARVLERMGRAEQSAQHYRAYLREARDVSEAERVAIERRLAKLRELRDRQRTQALKSPPSETELAAEARSFFRRGASLFARRRFGDALVAFEAAQRFAPLPELSFNLALTAEQLGQPRAAVDHLRAYLRAAPQAEDAEAVRERIQALLAQQAAAPR